MQVEPGSLVSIERSSKIESINAIDRWYRKGNRGKWKTEKRWLIVIIKAVGVKPTGS